MPNLTTIADLCGASRTNESWHLRMVSSEIGGGKLTLSELSAIEKSSEASVLTISGLEQRTFETLVRSFGAQFVGIHFWKCPRIEDLTPLEDLPNLTHLAFYWNQRVTRLWNFSRNPNLRGLLFNDFTRMHDLGDLANADSIAELRFGDALWSKSTFLSLSPLAAMDGLRILDFDAKRIDDGQVQPLARLTCLQSLEFPPNLFTTRQVAWLRARLPDSVASSVLVPFKRFHGPKFEADEKARDSLVVGKRKPWLNFTKDARRLDRYDAEFRQLVDAFRNDPDAIPDE